MTLPRNLQSALHKYAFLTNNPTGKGLPASATAPKPSAPLGPGLMDMARNNSAAAAARPAGMPAQPKPTGLASASIGAAPPGRQNFMGAQRGNNSTALNVAPPSAATAGQSPLFSGRQQVNPATFAQMRAQQSQQQGQTPAQRTPGILREGEAPRSHTGMGSYVDVLDRWYNPWTTQQVTERGEEGLMRAGQTAMGTAAVAGAAAAAIPAAGAVGIGSGTGGSMTVGSGTLGTLATAGNVAGTAATAVQGGEYAARAATGRDEHGNKVAPAPQAAPTQPGQQQQQPAGAQAQPDAAKPAAPMTPEQKQQANTDVMAKLNSDIPDAEKKQLAQQHVQQMLDSNPEMKQGMADLHAGKDTPQSKAFQAEVDKAGNAYIREEFAKLRQANPGASPQQQGGMLNSVMQGWQNMPEPMKWMMGIGLGGGLLGMLGGMFGGGGGMGMLGLLGLGAAGMAGAAGGMFGGGAQNFMADAISGIGKSMGMVPEKLTDEQKKILLAKDPVAQVTNTGMRVPTREEAAQQAASGRQQLGQIQMLNSMGGMTPRMLENMGLSAEEAQLAAKNVGTLSSAYSDQNSALNQHIAKGENYAKPTWQNWAYETMSAPTRWFGGKSSADRGYALARQWAKEADDKDIKEWGSKYRARGKGGRWVNTQRSSRMTKRVACAN